MSVSGEGWPKQLEDVFGPNIHGPSQKLLGLERSLAQERGEFFLFALIVREKRHTGFDLVVSAPWLKSGDREDLEFLVKKINHLMAPDELKMLSAVHILKPNAQFVRSVTSSVGVKRSGTGALFVNCAFNGINIKGMLVAAARNSMEEIQ